MQKIFLFVCLFGLTISSCKKETPIGASYPVLPDYDLPQGNASQAANDKIQEIYDTYGSYFIYEYTQKDIDWASASGKGSSKAYKIDKADPDNIEDVVNFVEKAWLKFIPEEKLKQEWMPYRVFLTDTIKQPREPGIYSPSQRNPIYYPSRVVDMALIFGGVYAWKKGMDVAIAIEQKDIVNYVVWTYYLDKGFIDLSPVYDKLIELSDYTSGAGYTDQGGYARGFVSNWQLPPSGSIFQLTQEVKFSMSKNYWYGSMNQWTAPRSYAVSDAKAYLYFMLHNDNATIQAIFDEYPLVKPKYDIVRNYFMQTYGFDPQTVGNANAGFSFN